MDIAALGIEIQSSGVEQANARLNKFGQETQKAENSVNSLGSTFSGLGKYISAATAALSVLGLGVFVKECMDAALQLERLNKLFNAAAGNASLAGREMAFVKDMANRLGLEVTSTAESYGKFMAAIRGTTLEGEKGRKVFESVAAASTALGLTTETTNRIFIAMQQMMSKGKVAAEELNGQLGESLPGALDMAARGMGVTRAELLKMMQEGKLMADELLPKLAIELDKTYGQAATDGANSAQAALNRFKNELFETKSALGTALMPALQAVVGFITPMVTKLREFIGGIQILAVKTAAALDRNRIGMYGGFKSSDYQQKIQNSRNAEEEAISAIVNRGAATTSNYTAAERARQAQNKSTAPADDGKAAAKAAREAAKAAREAENWRKTYSDLQTEIDKLNPAFDEHAQKIADITNKYDDLMHKKGANITKLRELRVALIAATIAQRNAKQAAEAHAMAMEEINAAMDKTKATQDLIDSSQTDFDFTTVTDQIQAIEKYVTKFGDRVPDLAEKGADAVTKLAAGYADKMIGLVRTAQQEAKELADVISKNAVDEADLKAAKALDDSSYRLFGGNDAINAQLEAEKTAIHAKYAAEQQAIQDQMDLLTAKSQYELDAIDRSHQATMAAIQAENEARYFNQPEILKAARDAQAESEKTYQAKLSKTRISDAKKTSAMLAALEKALSISKSKEQTEINDAEKTATKQKLNMYSDYAGAAASLFSAMADAQDQSSRKGFETAKAFNLAAAVMSTAAGIMNQYTSGDPYTANIRAAVVAAEGAIQIAQIASTSYGGGSNSVKAPSGSFNSGSSASSLGSNSGIGSMIGTQYSSVYDQQTQESLQKLADSADNASLAIGKVADGLTDIASLFDDEGSYLSLATGALSSPSGDKTASTMTTIRDVLLNTNREFLTITDHLSGSIMTSTVDIISGIKDLTKGNILDAIYKFSGIGNIVSMFTGTFSSLKSALFGGKWYTKSAGIALSLSGDDVNVDDYLYKKKSGGLFGSSKKKYVYSDDDVWTGIIQTTIDSIASTINHAAVAMGTTSNFSAASLGLTRIQTTGRSEEDIAADLQTWLESASNALAKTVTGLKEYTFYNENAFDALVRLSTALQSTNEAFELIGATLLDSSLADANSAYLLQQLFGGSEEFADAIDTYFTSMFTDTQQEAMLAAQAARQVNTAFAEMGVTAPTTRAGFIALVNSLDISTEYGASLFAALMDISEAFGTMTTAAEDAAAKLRDTFLDTALEAANALESIMGGSLSTMSPTEKLMQQQAAWASALANNNTEALPDLAQSYLEAAQAYYGSSTGYTSIYDIVTSVLGNVAGIDGDITVDSVERQISALTDVQEAISDGTMATVASIAELKVEIKKAVDSLQTIETKARLAAAA